MGLHDGERVDARVADGMQRVFGANIHSSETDSRETEEKASAMWELLLSAMLRTMDRNGKRNNYDCADMRSNQSYLTQSEEM